MRQAGCKPRQPSSGRGTRKAPASLDDRYRAAGRGLAALKAPRKAAERDLLVEYIVDAATEILDVDHVVRKQQRVHDLVVGFWKDIVEPATELLLRVLGLVRTDAPDDRVHGMVGAAGVDRDPAHPSLQHPLGEGAGRPRVADEVLGLIDLGAVGPVLRVVPVIAGMNDEDVAVLDAVAGVLLPPLEVLGAIEVEVAEAHAL